MERLEIRLSGAGGQGLMLSTHMLATAFNMEGHLVAQSQAYEPTSRGGLSRSDLVVSGGGEIDYPLASALDHLVILDQAAAGASGDLITPSTRILLDQDRVTSFESETKAVTLPFTDIARRLGNVRVANLVALGALVGAENFCQWETLVDAAREHVPKRLLDLNLEALESGRALAKEDRSAA
ncbi:MAG: pyruvate ferredoxin oxidoreductase [Rhodospirillaceae bacterium]|nr:pyruvate ferredoxin oxidoreductase [Rhodospirillaceae bacterium]